MLTLLTPQFYPPYRRAAPLPKRSAPIPIGCHPILPTDYFQQSYQEKLLPELSPLVGLELSTPMCFIVIWTSRCKVSDRDSARHQWKQGNVRRGHTCHQSVWYGAILTHAALFEFVAKRLLEQLFSRLRNIWALQLSSLRQPGYVKVKFGDHDDYWH